MRPEILPTLRELPTTSHGLALKEYLEFKIGELADVTKATSWEDTLARKHALKILEDVLHFYGDNSPVVSRTKKQYT